jgi:hypothetical protein
MGFEELVGRVANRGVFVDVMTGWRSVDGAPVSLNEKGRLLGLRDENHLN